VVGISLRRRDQLKPDVVWAVLGKVIQSNAKFGLSDRLDVHLDHVRMPAGNGRMAEKTKGRSLGVLSAIKKSIVVVKAEFLCLAHALVIAMVRVNSDPKYKSYRLGRCLNKPVEDLLKASGVDLYNGGGLEELQQFQDYFSDYKIVVSDGLSPDRLIFSGNSLSAKKLYLLFYSDNGHYNVIPTLRQLWLRGTYVTRVTLSTTTHSNVTKPAPCVLLHDPCNKDHTKYCSTCNRYFLIEKCFQNHMTLKVKSKLVCQWKKVCRNCSYLVTGVSKHECNKTFCTSCNKSNLPSFLLRVSTDC